MASTIKGAVLIELKASRPKRSNTPASMAEAIAIGIRFIMRSNNPDDPAMMMSTAHSTNAPMASGIVTPAALVAMSAAPGVDHAATTGFR